MSKKNNRKNEELEVIGSEMSFAGKEAYNLLRTNLLFSVRQEDRNARVVGITSANHGEGKSLTALNLGYSMATNGLKVLLIECDLRLPSIGEKLGIRGKTSGLSNLLAGVSVDESVFHKNVLTDGLTVLLAGSIPPNPSELLGSERMHALLDRYKDVFDYILLDLPPVNIVVDALVITKWTDGIIVVLANTIRQLKYVNTNIAGIVLNGTSKKRSSYHKYGYGYYKKEKK